MHRRRRNDTDRRWPEQLRDAVHDNFEFALKHVRDLFMRVGMFRQDGPGRNVPIDERLPADRMNFPRQPGKGDLTGRPSRFVLVIAVQPLLLARQNATRDADSILVA